MDTLLATLLVRLGVALEHVGGRGTLGTPARRKSNTSRTSAGGKFPRETCATATQAQCLSLVANLKALVKKDLEISGNGLRETCVRAAGFWGYAGKTVFHRMAALSRKLEDQIPAEVEECE